MGIANNAGAIHGSGTGVRLDHGGIVRNGVSGSATASILGGFVGVGIYGAIGTVANSTTIIGGQIGVNMQGGGTLVNGGVGDTTALIRGQAGVWGNGRPLEVTNYGLIRGRNLTGVDLFGGGSVRNGSAADPTASIYGYRTAITFEGQSGTIFNYGTVASILRDAVFTGAGSRVVNGSAVDNAAQISSIYGYGAAMSRSSTLVNYGTISGYRGVSFGTQAAAETVFNHGTIIGLHGAAVKFGIGTDRLVVYPGAAFIGSVVATTGASTLELSSSASTGTIAGIGHNFQNFSTITVDSGASWHLAGTNKLGQGTLSDLGRLANASQLTGSVSLGVGGYLVNAAGATIVGSVIGGPSSTVVNLGIMTAVSGAGVSLVGGCTVVNAGTIIGVGSTAVQFGAGNDQLTLAPGAQFTGAVVASTSGANTVELAAGKSAGSLGGLGTSFVNFGTLAVSPGAQWTLTGGNSLGSSGGLSLGSGASLAVSGSLVVRGSLSITGTGTLSVPKTGTAEIGNGSCGIAGRLLVGRGSSLVGSGTVAGRITVRGAAVARDGVLDLQGIVNGPGTIAVGAGATLELASKDGVSSMAFLPGSGETLILKSKAALTGTITGFGTAGTGEKIHLAGIVANSSAFSAGVLTLSSAGATAMLHFAGHYTLSDFHVTSDGHGGTTIGFV
jgi:hypothetical protein